MTDFLGGRSLVAKRALFDAGFELAGVRLQVFAERLLAAAEASPDASVDQLAHDAIEGIEGGAVALIAEEPMLLEYRLPEPATTVSDAADSVVCGVAHRLLDVVGMT